MADHEQHGLVMCLCLDRFVSGSTAAVVFVFGSVRFSQHGNTTTCSGRSTMRMGVDTSGGGHPVATMVCVYQFSLFRMCE